MNASASVVPLSGTAAATNVSELRNPDNEALIESCFRRLLASVEAEREKIRTNWSQIEQETETIKDELERLRHDTDEWCLSERVKIDNEWKRLDRLRERMSVLWATEASEILDINCSGTLFQIPRSALCSVEGSYLNHMFSDAFIQQVPRDAHGRFFLDFNPICFEKIVEFLQRRMRRPDAPAPMVPPEQQQNMDMLADALKLKAFMRVNSIPPNTGTSLRIEGDTIQATHSGWQVIAARYSLWMADNAYFEVKVLANPDPKKGGLAVGVCGHTPEGHEIHTIRFDHGVLYAGGNGLVGTAVATHNVEPGVQFGEGTTVGVRHDAKTRNLHWYHNRILVGSCTLRSEEAEHMRVLFPIFALYVPNQKVQVDFNATAPAAVRATTQRGGTDLDEFVGS